MQFARYQNFCHGNWSVNRLQLTKVNKLKQDLVNLSVDISLQQKLTSYS